MLNTSEKYRRIEEILAQNSPIGLAELRWKLLGEGEPIW